jgi:S1-C subfamily serine protease
VAAGLVFLSGGLRGKAFSLGAAGAVIGRDPGVDIIAAPADEQFVSRRHCLIRREGTDWVIEDLNSSNGTHVNGTLVTRVVLEDGDEVQIGRTGPAARFYVDLDSRAVAERPSEKLRRDIHRQLTFMAAAVALTLITAAVGLWYFFVYLNPDAALRRIAAAHEQSVVLIEVGLKTGSKYLPLNWGTGFIADNDGFIVTNKHVVAGEFYTPALACALEDARRAGAGGETVYTAWLGGTQFRKDPSQRYGDRGLGFSSEAGTLALIELAPNRDGVVELKCDDPKLGTGPFSFEWHRQPLDNNDLAVMRLTASRALIPLSLSRREPVNDEDMMVFGFPRALDLLETNDAVPMRRTGQILRVQESVQYAAATLSGNSGGPLIDTRGEVIGITQAGFGDNSVNFAIKPRHAQVLLDRARGRVNR